MPGSYFAEVDLGHFGVGEIGRIPLWIRAESATGASLAPVPPSVPPPPRFVRGDVNSDGAINLTDGIAILSHLFQGTEVPQCRDAADADDNGALQLTDAIVIFQFLFLGEDPPREPSPPRGRAYEAEDCGIDPTRDDPLECVMPAETCRSCPGP